MIRLSSRFLNLGMLRRLEEYQGCTKSAATRLYAYRQEFETARLKSGESIENYVSRVLIVLYHIRAPREVLSEQEVVGNILRSLTPKFSHLVSSIIEAKDLSALSVEELSGSLKGHEGRLNMAPNQVKEKAFHIKPDTTLTNPSMHVGRGRARGSFRGRSRGRGRGRTSEWRGPHDEN